MTNTLKLVLTDYWFEEIKSGRQATQTIRAIKAAGFEVTGLKP